MNRVEIRSRKTPLFYQNGCECTYNKCKTLHCKCNKGDKYCSTFCGCKGCQNNITRDKLIVSKFDIKSQSIFKLNIFPTNIEQKKNDN